MLASKKVILTAVLVAFCIGISSGVVTEKLDVELTRPTADSDEISHATRSGRNVPIRCLSGRLRKAVECLCFVVFTDLAEIEQEGLARRECLRIFLRPRFIRSNGRSCRPFLQNGDFLEEDFMRDLELFGRICPRSIVIAPRH
eukprot:GFKZ01001943.1.p1 GENE.GFKZ01001943.1~~GFKZ01001943.1.p1  ORF type:complete len:143 (-),score=12.84 GFKZ01001943.1:420-848(-)